MRKSSYQMKTPDSPPLVRGRLSANCAEFSLVRFTPTRVGTITSHFPYTVYTKIHPRLRGAIDFYQKQHGRGIDSPPLAQGQQRSTVIPCDAVGFTPLTRDDFVCSLFAAYSGALPPPERGQQFTSAISPTLRRFTPVHTGMPVVLFAVESLLQIYPRLHGAYAPNVCFASTFTDSPPLARGRNRYTHNDYLANGFTPACAGTIQ